MLRLAGALLLVPMLASAEPTRLFDPPKTDDSPTAFACTAETLARGAECVFEGHNGPASAAENTARLRQMASASCEAALKSALPSDASALRSACLARMNAAADRCGGESAAVDASGRFTSRGKSCYRALLEARNQAESLANAAPTCCECLARNGCGGAGASCVASAAQSRLSASCNSDVCDAACTELMMVGQGPVAKSTAKSRAPRAK